ncbi:head GIN domain-containing protein [Algoriphagus marinus]|uniref:head GIN domain-containing protein n=1 Tax=Algoriphagus marinus TaxID=1925762 RepID=UPI00094BBDD5|nr:head GIN domain-containing protein [Algoriphagus marinus]
MKLTKIASLIILLFLVGFTAQAQTETRTPGTFKGIESGGNWDVFVTIGNKDEVRLESKGFDLNKVITEVDGGVLKIKLEKGNWNNVNFTAYVTVKELESVGVSGSGKMILQSNINSRKFSIGQSGSGNIQMKMLQTEALNVGMSGSGKVTIEGGSADRASIGQSGSGEFEALDLMAGDVKIGKSGSGTTSIGVNGNLTVGSSGSGNVYYKGNPTNQKIASSGSSKVIKR